MAANGTNQSRLRQLQGGAQRDRGSYERDQYYNRATSPNTINNQPNTQGATGMRSNFGYNPMGSQGVGGQYGTQQGNLGRYRPPTMNGNGGWNDSGGYAYNLPNAYGSTGLGYMSGLGNMFSPWQGNMNPQMNYGGGYSFQDMWNNYFNQQQGNQPPNQAVGRDNRVGGPGPIPRFGRYPEGPSMGIAPNPQIAPGTGGSTGGNSRPGGGTGMGTVAPSPVGGVTNQQAPVLGMGANRFWWGGNGG